MSELPPILNQEEGLKRVGGNKSLYKRLLGMYVANNYMSQLTVELSSGDLAAAQTTAHSIKGLAANLSMIRLHQTALALETCLKTGQPYDDAFSAVIAVTGETMAATQELIAALG